MLKVQKLDFLVSFYITCVLLSNLMGAKTVYLFSLGAMNFNGTVALLVLPLIYSINDIIIEVFGKDRARSVVQTSLLMVIFVLLYSIIVTLIPPSSRFAPMENAYDTIFGVSIRFSIASIVAFTVSEFTDIYIFSKLRQKLGKSKLWLRTNLSNFISEFLDVILFMVIAFYAPEQSFADNASFIFSITVPYYLLRCFMSVIETPLVYLGVKWLKKGK